MARATRGTARAEASAAAPTAAAARTARAASAGVKSATKTTAKSAARSSVAKAAAKPAAKTGAKGAGRAATSKPAGKATGRSAVKAAAGRSGPPAAEVSDPVVAGQPLSRLAELNGGTAGPRSKRGAIVDTAVEFFGQSGYEATKWSQVADRVGIGQPALYHYFESKAHCLLTIMRLELARSHQRFLTAVADQPSPAGKIEAAVVAAFDVSPAEVSQLRILMANGDILANARSSEREEAERLTCLALAHRIEVSWTDVVRAHLAESPRDHRDAKMLALLVLGLINSVWRWYRVTGPQPLAAIAELYVEAARRAIA